MTNADLEANQALALAWEAYHLFERLNTKMFTAGEYADFRRVERISAKAFTRYERRYKQWQSLGIDGQEKH